MSFFVKVMREGVQSDGTTLRPPMAGLVKFGLASTDGELKALYAYLQGLPPVATGK